jgi:HD superfamily phosphohydrolase
MNIIDKPIDNQMDKQTDKIDKITKIGQFKNTYKYIDIIHGVCELSLLSMKIMNHSIFQRLKELKQLGPYYMIDANGRGAHNRFDHSVGVAYLSRFTVLSLQKKNPMISDRLVLLVEVAGLCHDLGHGPFSHTFDDMLHTLFDKHPNIRHENRSLVLLEKIIRDLQKEGECDITDNELQLIKFFIEPKIDYKFNKSDELIINTKFNIEYYQGVEQIVNNKLSRIDVDKIDYLMRDAYHLQVNSLTNWDIKMILSNSNIINGCWAFDGQNSNFVTELLFRRSMFYENFYLKPDSLNASIMISDMLKKISSNINVSSFALANDNDIKDYCKLTDKYIIELVLNNEDEFKEANDLLHKLLRKELYKPVAKIITMNAVKNAATSSEKSNTFQDKNSPVNVLPTIRLISGDRLVKLIELGTIFTVYDKNY